MKPLLQAGILAILDKGVCPDAGRMIRGAVRLAKAGIRFFQYRAKGLNDMEFISVAMELKRALPGCVITINDRCDIAASAGVQGVHLGADDIPVFAARSILGKRCVVGSSAGNNDELRSALSMRPDYLSFGPAFATSTKRDAGQALGPGGFRSMARLVPKSIPILAVGGITPDNAGILIDEGADAVAVASWWWRGGNPDRAARKMLEAVRLARKK